MCQNEGTHQIVMSFSPPVVGCLLKKAHKRGGHRHPRTPPPGYAPASLHYRALETSLRCGCLGSSVVRAPFMRSGCRGFESRSGHLIFSSICSVYIDRHIRVDLSDDEQYVRNMPCYIICMGLLIHLVR